MNNNKNNDLVTVFEVGPRDGLQSIKTQVPTNKKIDLVNALSKCGFKKIEVTSFVSAKWVPQLADANEVMQAIERNSDVLYTCLTPNLRGFNAAVSAKADEIAIFTSASEGFNHANLNCSIQDSLERFYPLMEHARDANIPVRGYLSTVIACPYDGPVFPVQTCDVATELLNMGCYEVSLGDTIGAGDGEKIDALLDCVLDYISADKLAGHFHDTQGTALEMIERCAHRGLRTFDSSIGGLGGCPYAPGASGNVDTRLVVERLHAMGFKTGIDLAQLEHSEDFANSIAQDL